MKKTGSIIFLIILFTAFLVPPFAVMQKVKNYSYGWKGIPWGKSEAQVKDIVLKNNSNAIWTKCSLSHFGVSCFKLSWKDKDTALFEAIEFQFKDEKLCAVIETGKPADTDLLKNNTLGIPDGGFDYSKFYTVEEGIKFINTQRIFYFNPKVKSGSTKVKNAVSTLVKTPAANFDIPDRIYKYRLTTGYFSKECPEEAYSKENFPTFKLKK